MRKSKPKEQRAIIGRFVFNNNGAEIVISHPAYGAVAVVNINGEVRGATNTRAPQSLVNGARKAFWEVVRRERAAIAKAARQ